MDEITSIAKNFSYKVLLLLVPVIFILLLLAFIKTNSSGTTRNNLKHARLKNAHGIIFGKAFPFSPWVAHSPAASEGHCCVFGGSGVGKTSAILIPTLRSWTGASFTIDISGDICKNVSCSNKIVYEPGVPSSIPYNIFADIDNLSETEDINEALEQLAFLIMPEPIKASDSGLFFTTEGRKFLTASLLAFYPLGLDFVEICRKIVSSSWRALLMEIDATQNKDAQLYINSFDGANEQNTAGCKQCCDAAIKLFATNGKVAASIRRPNQGEPYFSAAKIESNNVFIVVPDEKLKLYSPLLNIITSQCLEFFATRPLENTRTILFSLDEFASLGKLEITDALRKLRKRHIRILMLTQSMADIDLIYGKEERLAMLNNFKYKLILSAEDTETQEYFSKLIGPKKTTLEAETAQTQKTAAIEASTLGHLGNKLILIHPGGWMKLFKAFYYR